MSEPADNLTAEQVANLYREMLEVDVPGMIEQAGSTDLPIAEYHLTMIMIVGLIAATGGLAKQFQPVIHAAAEWLKPTRKDG